ncbi:InlB B-repeat-containing protein [Diplocloster hominis]|uniref:InlB B-repeat-containing protein n=1 Tax=Diplocloster hominis TaxID=3079010 RepID=UPI0031BA0728
MQKKYRGFKRRLAMLLACTVIFTSLTGLEAFAGILGDAAKAGFVKLNAEDTTFIATPYTNEKGEVVEGLENAVSGKRHWLETTEPLPVEVKEEKGSLTIGNGIVERKFKVPEKGGSEFYTSSYKNLYIDKEMMDTDDVRPDVYLGLYDKPYREVYSDEGIKITHDPISSADNTIEIPKSCIKADPDYYFIGGKQAGNTFVFDGYEIQETCEKPFEWTPNEFFGDPAAKEWPPKGKHLEFNFSAPAEFPQAYQGIKVKVIYEMYDNVPAMKKRVEITNTGDQQVMIGRLAPEVLNGNQDMEDLLALETDFTCGDQSTLPINRALPCKCELEKEGSPFLELKDIAHTCYEVGPAYELVKDQSMIGYNTYEFTHSTYWFELKMRERLGIYRTLFPWITDNPLTHHNTGALTKEVIDEAAAAEFEMIIQSYSAPDSSGQMLTRDQKTLDHYKELVDYAHSKGIAIGIYQAQYQLGQYKKGEAYGTNATGHWDGWCVATAAFDDYWDNFKNFVQYTGLDCVEIDGTYPGTYCNSGEKHVNEDKETDPADPTDTTTGKASKYSFHNGVFDSVVKQWENSVRMMCKDFRDMGVYIKVPAWYYLNGANKCGIGYEEAAWSQPRHEQLMYGRQIMYNASYGRTMSMSWSHVPFAEYHGGGGDAAFQPFKDKKEDYNWVIAQNVGNGVNSDFRGPHLYDDGTQDILNKWVEFYKRYRGIVNSDMVHISQATYDAAGTNRQRGTKMDTLYHVNALNEGEKGLLWVYNQTDEERTEIIDVPMYYTGLSEGLNYPPVPLNGSLGKDVHRYGAYPPNYKWIPQTEANYRQPDTKAGDYGEAAFMKQGVQSEVLSIDSNGNAQLKVTLPPMSFTYYSIYDTAEAPEVTLEVGKVSGLEAREVTENSAELHWDKDVSFTMTENGVVIPNPAVTIDGYMVYRDGDLIAQTMDNTYTDSGLKEQQKYTYTVKAVANGVEGALSDPAEVDTQTDLTAPLVAGIKAINETTVEISFNENVDAVTAEDTANYSISEGIAVKSAAAKGEKVTLTTDKLSLLQPYTLEVEKVCDASKNKNEMEPYEQRVIYGYIAKFGFEQADEGLITDAFHNYTGKAYYMDELEQTYGSSVRLNTDKKSYGNLGSGLLKGMEQYSMSVWFKTDQAEKQVLLSQGQDRIPEDDLTLWTENGSLNFHISDGTGNDVTLQGGTIVSDQWNLAAAVRDGDTFTLYLNGEEISTQSAQIGENNTQNALLAGAMTNNAGGDRVYFYSGDLSEISIYNVPLNAENVKLLARSGLAALSTVMDEAKAVDGSLFTDETYQALKAVMDEVDSKDPAGMMPAEIADMIDRLQEAQDKLQLADGSKELTALYHMDEEKGETIANAIPGHNAKFINGEYMRVGTPFHRGAYLYENIQNYISIPDSPIWGMEQFTVNGWFKPQLYLDTEVTDTIDPDNQVQGTPKQVLLADQEGNFVLSLQKRKLVLEISDGNTTEVLTAPEEFAMETVTGGETRQAWNHFSVVRSKDTFTLFLNGTQMGQVSLENVTVGDSLTIGAKLNEKERELQYNGLVDEFSFYGAALEDADIEAASQAIPFRKSERENIALGKKLNSDGMSDAQRLNDGKVLDFAGKERDTPWTARSNGTVGNQGLKYEIDLGAVYDIDAISLTQFFRNYKNEELRRFRDVVIQISTTADFAAENTVTVLNTDTENRMGCGAGSDQTFYSFALGNDFILDQPVPGRYVRLKNSGFYNLSGGYSGYVNVSELEVYGSKAPAEPELNVSAEDIDLKVAGDREFVKVTVDADTNLRDLTVTSGDEGIATANWSAADGLQINAVSGGNTDITLTHPKDNSLTKVVHVTVEGLEPTAVINDNDPAIIYTGGFSYYNGRGGDPDGVTEYSRDIHYGNTGDATAEYTFTGTGIDIVTTVNVDGCLLGVSIDGEAQPDVNTKTPNDKYFKRANQMCVFSKTDLSYGEHTIRLENKGGNITVDAFRIYTDESKHLISLEDVNVETPLHVLPVLPETVKATYGDGHEMDVTVTWDEVSQDQVETMHEFTVEGSVEGTALKAKAIVIVGEAETYEVVFMMDDSEYARASAEKGQEITMPEEPVKEGLRFTGWFTQAAGGEKVEDFTTSKIVYAQFEEILYHITVSQTEHGEIQADKETAAKDTRVYISVTPESGYRLTQDSLTVLFGETHVPVEVSGDSYSFLMPEGDVNITGTFEPAPRYMVIVTDGTGSGEYGEGDQVSITADNAPEGKEFDRWISSDVEIEQPEEESTTFIMIAQDVTVTATYKDVPVIGKSYKVTVKGGSGSGDFEEGAAVEIVADDLEGKRFVKWMSDDVEFADAVSGKTSFIMPGKDVTVEAVFEDIGESDYLERTVDDPDHKGFLIYGQQVHKNAKLSVEELKLDDCNGCKEFREYLDKHEDSFVWSGNLTLSEDFKGDITATIPTDPKFNGSKVLVLHAVPAGLERFETTVNDGRVKVNVSSLSPFAVFITKDDDPVMTDKSGLQKIYDKYAELKQGDYTDESFKVFSDARAHALAVMKDDKATQQQINEAITKLEIAVKELKLKDQNKGSDSDQQQQSDSSQQTAGAPQTGDSAPIVVWVLFALAAIGTVIFILYRKRQSSGGHGTD